MELNEEIFSFILQKIFAFPCHFSVLNVKCAVELTGLPLSSVNILCSLARDEKVCICYFNTCQLC